VWKVPERADPALQTECITGDALQLQKYFLKDKILLHIYN
jgi:hypothetical protein